MSGKHKSLRSIIDFCSHIVLVPSVTVPPDRFHFLYKEWWALFVSAWNVTGLNQVCIALILLYAFCCKLPSMNWWSVGPIARRAWVSAPMQCVMVINEWFAGPPYFMERNGTFGKHKTAMQVLSHLHKHQLDLKERYYILVPILLELEAHTRTRVPARRFHQAISSVRQFVEIRHCSEDLHVAVPCFPSVRSFPSIPFHETRSAQ